MENKGEYAFKVTGRFLDCWSDLNVRIRVVTLKRRSKLGVDTPFFPTNIYYERIIQRTLLKPPLRSDIYLLLPSCFDSVCVCV